MLLFLQKGKETISLFNKQFSHYHNLSDIYGQHQVIGANAIYVDDDEEETREGDDISVNLWDEPINEPFYWSFCSRCVKYSPFGYCSSAGRLCSK